MSLVIGDNFQFLGSKPLDSRLTFSTLADMVAMADSTLYNGIIAYCVGEDKNYQWKSTNPVDQTLGKWREFESGGASDLDDLGDVEITDVADGDVLKYDATEGKWVNGEDVGGAGRAKSSAIAPVFDDTETYAAGDRVMYEDELYVFNTAHTGAWAAADADKSDVDNEIPDKLTSQQMQEIKDAFVVDSPRNGYPVLFDETGAERFVGWYKYANGTKKPIYQKTVDCGRWTTGNPFSYTHNIANIDRAVSIDCYAYSSASNQIMVSDSKDTDVYFSRTAIVLSGSSPFGSGYSIYATLQYTKTTDQTQ